MADRGTVPGAGAGGEGGEEAGERARRAAGRAAGAVKEQARELKGIARDQGAVLKERALNEAESRKGRASSRVRSLSFALEDAAETLEQRGEAWLAARARTGAEQVDRLTGYFEDRDVREIAREVEDALRARPRLLLAGTFAAGFGLSRLLRAHAPDDHGADGLARHGYESRTAPGAPGGYPTSRGYATTRGYVGTAPRRHDGGPRRPARVETAPGAREPEPDVLADLELPGTRTGGAAMASHRAGSGRGTEADRARS